MNCCYRFNSAPYSAFVTSGIRCSTHSHSHVEITYLLNGSLEYQIENQTYLISSKELIIVFPYQPHSIRMVETGIMVSIVFAIDFISDFTRIFTEYELPNCLFKQRELNDSTVTALQWLKTSALTKEYKKHPIPFKERGWLIVALGDIFSKRALQKKREKLDMELISSFFEYLNNHFVEDLSCESVCRALGISQYYLTHTLNKILHTTFNSIIISYRLKLAENLLKTSDLTILDIALETGFQNAQTFSRNFKKHSGLTPSAFRKNLFITNTMA